MELHNHPLGHLQDSPLGFGECSLSLAGKLALAMLTVKGPQNWSLLLNYIAVNHHIVDAGRQGKSKGVEC